MYDNLRTHGLSNTPTYRTWQSMKNRCLNKKDINYYIWGGRGITLCVRWKKFENFLEDMGIRPDGMTLDRRNNSKGYNKENCRWATDLEQNNNMRSNKIILFNGESHTMAQWCRALGLNYQTVKKRLQYGWKIERAFNLMVK